MAKINIEFDGKVYSVDENTLTSLASPLRSALIHQLAGTGAVIRLGGTDYNVDADKLGSARNVLTDHLGNVAGTDNKVIVNGTEYGLSKTKLQGATDKMNETFGIIGSEVKEPSQGLYFTLNDDQQSYSVTGIGTCTDTDLVIPAEYEELSVTSIGEGAFAGYTNLTSVMIPDSVTNIRDYAFQDCSDLTSVTIGSGVTSIGSSAFFGCSRLKSVTIPDSVTNIRDYAFSDCSRLKSVTIGSGVTSIGNWAFLNCDSLIDIYINKPEGSISLGKDWCPSTVTVHWNSTGPET